MGPDWHQMGQMWDFLRSVSQNEKNFIILNSSRFVPFGAKLAQFEAKPDISGGERQAGMSDLDHK